MARRAGGARASSRAHLRATLDKACAGGSASGRRMAVMLGLLGNDDADVARHFTAWGAACADGAGDACVSYAYALSPDDAHDVRDLGLEHLEKYRDEARGKDAWAKACADSLRHRDDPGADRFTHVPGGANRACKPFRRVGSHLERTPLHR